MQTRHLIEALRKGDRLQVLRAASLGAAHMAATGKRETRLELALVEITKNIADRDGRPEVVVFYVGARGIGLWNRGRWKEAQGMLERAMSLHMPGFPGFSTVRLFDTYVHYFLGAFRETQRRMRRLLIDAADRGDLFTSVNARTAVGIWLSLVGDEPDHARREMSDAIVAVVAQGLLSPALARDDLGGRDRALRRRRRARLRAHQAAPAQARTRASCSTPGSFER